MTGSIQTRGLAHSFGQKVALHPLDLDIGSGGVVGLLGPNGSGKSTLMRLLVGLVPKRVGSATVAGVPLEGDGRAIRERTTYAPGELHLYSELKGRDHLRYLLRGRGRDALKRATEIALGLGLPLDRSVRGYSHGMKRQLIFAMAMAPDVKVRILDEISEGLDPAKRTEILDEIERDTQRGVTILLSSHHLGEVDRSCERLIFINDGKLIADETASSVSERAARIVRVTYPADADLSGLETSLAAAGTESLRVEGREVHALLKDKDPREFLGVLSRAEQLPAPVAVEHGRLSLRDLYRTLYGVEGT